jgi:hypothetical protein
LPDQSKWNALLLRAEGQPFQLVDILRRMGDQIRAPVQHPHVDEPGQRMQHAIPAVRRDGCWKEIGR